MSYHLSISNTQWREEVERGGERKRERERTGREGDVGKEEEGG